MEENQIALPQGLYTDGKRASTLVRQTTETGSNYQEGGPGVPTRQLSQLVIEDHYPIVAEPGGNYVTLVTPNTGLDLANEIVSVVQERGSNIKVIGMDGCPVNT